MKKIFFVLYLILFGLLGFYSNDLVQKNTEELFLNDDGLKNYIKYKSKVSSNEVLLLKVEYSQTISDLNRNEFKNEILRITSESEFELLLSEDLSKAGENIIKLSSDDFLAVIITGKNNDRRMKFIIEEILNSKYLNSKKSIKLAGNPYTNFLLDNYSIQIKEKLFPVMFLLSFVLMCFFIKNFYHSILLFIPCLMNSVLSLAVIKFYWGEMNMVTSIVPLITFTVSLCIILHLYYALNGENAKKAISQKIKPIILMVVTTFIGFASLYFSDIQVVKDFGILSCFLIIISFALILIWFFIVFSNLSFSSNMDSLFWMSIRKIVQKRLSSFNLMLISFLIIIAGLYSFYNIKFETDATEYFPKKSGLKESILNVNQTVSGMPLLEILIESDNDFEIEDYLRLMKIEEKLLLEMEKKKFDFKFLSLVQAVRNINFEYSNSRGIPDNLNAFFTLRGVIPEALKESMPIGKYYKITILGNPIGYNSYQEYVDFINSQFIDLKRFYKIELNGLYYNLMISQHSMIMTLIKSFSFAIFLVSLISLLFFGKLKFFIVFLIANVTPIMASVFALYIFQFSINIATVMTFSIGIGLVVDSSYHIAYSLILKKTLPSDYYKKTIAPIIISSIIMALSFLSFLFNDFLPIGQFGFSLGVIIFIGMIFDVLFLPAFIQSIVQKKEVYDEKTL